MAACRTYRCQSLINEKIILYYITIYPIGQVILQVNIYQCYCRWVHCPCLRCVRPRAITFLHHRHSIPNKTSKEKGSFLSNHLFLLYLSNVSTSVLKLYKLQKLSLQVFWYTPWSQMALKFDWRSWFLWVI